MGGLGAVLEPAIVVGLLFGGTWINRNKSYNFTWRDRSRPIPPRVSFDEESIPESPGSWATDDALLQEKSSTGLLNPDNAHAKWRTRELKFFGLSKSILTPNSRAFETSRFSRFVKKMPFIQEVWYWALIYWVYQLGRAFTALTLVEGTVHVARKHALQVIELEKSLHIFWEVPIQQIFLQHPLAMTWINRIYSFIHIPGTILFLVWLYSYTTPNPSIAPLPATAHTSTLAGPRLFEARRRTMATCNLIAFIIFTLWPCMPPRLLSDPTYTGSNAPLAKSYGFVDTVHGDGGEGSVWTQNKFCNQYAAMPSLHFGYSLLIGLTILTIPLASDTASGHRKSSSGNISISFKGSRLNIPCPRWKRALCVLLGIAYPLTILVAIIATANHFILDAVAGAMVCGIAWWGNDILLNLLPLEDWFLYLFGFTFTERGVANEETGSDGYFGRN
ncbi:hypothetical protein FKW77_003178 [Venturia effusa]|uniref:Inositolphosphotransferase Aur1/Ipt1 domain-containing protein n=1 Tax=Venturia effusa TaxID=50376 RepID=A0A517LNM0_9PEZI|nr:hypothetical protein FKW77_003178 [Venturia effusa]